MTLKLSSFVFSLFLLVGVAKAQPEGYEAYARLLDRYVHEDGVAYAEWHASPSDVRALDEVLEAFGRTDVAALSEDAQMAFYINLYNAAMLQAVMDAYPVSSVTDIKPDFGVFKRQFIELQGRSLSLDQVEKGILLERWDEPRIHFAVNCASESCPPLRGEPFTAAELDTQLQEQTVAFANSQRAVTADSKAKTLRFNAIFSWYADDFPGEKPTAYVNRFRENKLSRKWKVEYKDYDWSLNAAN
ncbi:MAG: DUF547 domain-containing protein [Opitutales bacterium]